MDEMDPQKLLFDDLRARGRVALTEMVEQKREETLHLEFKTLSNHETANLMKEDRRLIAKSLCGLCNAEGGLLVLGVATIKADGIDIANTLKPFQNVDALRNRIMSALPELLSPQNSQMSVISIPDPPHQSTGFIVIHVPASVARPHMSISHHQYFRRGSDGTRLLEHGEIKELILLPQQAKLSLQYRMRWISKTGYNYSFDCILSLRNEGKVSVRAPFIKANGRAILPIVGNDPALKTRYNQEGAGIYADRGVLVHVEDQFDMAIIRAGMQLHGADGYDANFFIQKILNERLLSNFSIRTIEESRNSRSAFDRPIEVQLAFGGENAPIQNLQLALDKWETFEIMAKALLG
jgi:hypothetical protein